VKTVGPYPPRDQSDRDIAAYGARRDHFEPIACIAGNRRGAGAENVARRRFAPMSVNLRRRIVVDIGTHAPLLIKDSRKIGDRSNTHREKSPFMVLSSLSLLK
jgi:hypothetical protein